MKDKNYLDEVVKELIKDKSKVTIYSEQEKPVAIFFDKEDKEEFYIYENGNVFYPYKRIASQKDDIEDNKYIFSEIVRLNKSHIEIKKKGERLT